MAAKTLSVYDQEPGSQPRRAVDLRLSEETQRGVMTLLPPSPASPNQDSRLRHLQTDLLGSEHYQVALVPPVQPVRRHGVGGSESASAPPILLLRLTWKELIAQVRAEVDPMRSGQHSVVRFGAVCVDLYSSEVSRSGKPVLLTALEFKLLKFFVTCPGRVIPRDELLNRVWGFENYPTTRTVDSHVSRLRKKLEPDAACPVHFQTVHGLGYKFVLEARGAAAAEQRM
jgi:DNA-binding winged helix-turn-helix (wHTH) protein